MREDLHLVKVCLLFGAWESVVPEALVYNFGLVGVELDLMAGPHCFDFAPLLSRVVVAL